MAKASHKMTMAEWERSPMDKKKDAAAKKKGIMEGSRKEQAMDKKALAAYNKKSGKK